MAEEANVVNLANYLDVPLANEPDDIEAAPTPVANEAKYEIELVPARATVGQWWLTPWVSLVLAIFGFALVSYAVVTSRLSIWMAIGSTVAVIVASVALMLAEYNSKCRRAIDRSGAAMD